MWDEFQVVMEFSIQGFTEVGITYFMSSFLLGAWCKSILVSIWPRKNYVLFSRHWEEVLSVFGALQVLKSSAYQVPTLALLKVRGIFAQSLKYVDVSKNIEIVTNFFSNLAINIVCSNDNFHFTLQSIEITMYWCILLSCIMFCYHHESYYTFKNVISKVRFFCQNHMDKRLLRFWVYDCCRVASY